MLRKRFETFDCLPELLVDEVEDSTDVVYKGFIRRVACLQFLQSKVQLFSCMEEQFWLSLKNISTYVDV